MSRALGRATYEVRVSVAASAIVALMVLAGGTALELVPVDPAEMSAALRPDQQNSLVMCRDDRFGFRCVAEES
jgi:hypothetical protein